MYFNSVSEGYPYYLIILYFLFVIYAITSCGSVIISIYELHILFRKLTLVVKF